MSQPMLDFASHSDSCQDCSLLSHGSTSFSTTQPWSSAENESSTMTDTSISAPASSSGGVRIRKRRAQSISNNGLPMVQSGSVHGSAHRLQPPSRFLVTVLPPDSLPEDPPRVSTACSGYGPPSKFRRGTLIPLYPTLAGQTSAIAREYGLPSVGGIVLYLVELNPQPTLSGSLSDTLLGGPRIGDEAWRLLWAQLFEHPSHTARDDLSVSSHTALSEDEENSTEEAIGMSTQARSEGQTRTTYTSPRTHPHVPHRQHASQHASPILPKSRRAQSPSEQHSDVSSLAEVSSVSPYDRESPMDHPSIPINHPDYQPIDPHTPKSPIEPQQSHKTRSSRHHHPSNRSGYSHSAKPSVAASPSTFHQQNTSSYSTTSAAGRRTRRTYTPSAAGSSSVESYQPVYGEAVVVGKVEFDIDRRKGAKWYDAWLESAHSRSSNISPTVSPVRSLKPLRSQGQSTYAAQPLPGSSRAEKATAAAIPSLHSEAETSVAVAMANLTSEPVASTSTSLPNSLAAETYLERTGSTQSNVSSAHRLHLTAADVPPSRETDGESDVEGQPEQRASAYESDYTRSDSRASEASSVATGFVRETPRARDVTAFEGPSTSPKRESLPSEDIHASSEARQSATAPDSTSQKPNNRAALRRSLSTTSSVASRVKEFEHSKNAASPTTSIASEHISRSSSVASLAREFELQHSRNSQPAPSTVSPLARSHSGRSHSAQISPLRRRASASVSSGAGSVHEGQSNADYQPFDDDDNSADDRDDTSAHFIDGNERIAPMPVQHGEHADEGLTDSDNDESLSLSHTLHYHADPLHDVFPPDAVTWADLRSSDEHDRVDSVEPPSEPSSHGDRLSASAGMARLSAITGLPASASSSLDPFEYETDLDQPPSPTNEVQEIVELLKAHKPNESFGLSSPIILNDGRMSPPAQQQTFMKTLQQEEERRTSPVADLRHRRLSESSAASDTSSVLGASQTQHDPPRSLPMPKSEFSQTLSTISTTSDSRSLDLQYADKSSMLERSLGHHVEGPATSESISERSQARNEQSDPDGFAEASASANSPVPSNSPAKGVTNFVFPSQESLKPDVSVTAGFLRQEMLARSRSSSIEMMNNLDEIERALRELSPRSLKSTNDMRLQSFSSMHVGTDGTDRPVATVAGYDHRSPTEYNAPATPQVGSRDGSVSYKAPASGSASRQLTINRPDITASTNHLLQSLGRQDQLPFSASASPARASSPFGSSRSGPSGNDSNLHEVRVDRGVPHKDSPLSAPVTGPPGYPARRNDQREGARSPKSATSAPSKFGALKLKAWPGSKGSKDLKDEKSDLPGGLPPKGQVSDKSSASSLQNNLQNGLQGLQKLKFWQANPSAELDATQHTAEQTTLPMSPMSPPTVTNNGETVSTLRLPRKSSLASMKSAIRPSPRSDSLSPNMAATPNMGSQQMPFGLPTTPGGTSMFKDGDVPSPPTHTSLPTPPMRSLSAGIPPFDDRQSYMSRSSSLDISATIPSRLPSWMPSYPPKNGSAPPLSAPPAVTQHQTEGFPPLNALRNQVRGAPSFDLSVTLPYRIGEDGLPYSPAANAIPPKPFFHSYNSDSRLNGVQYLPSSAPVTPASVQPDYPASLGPNGISTRPNRADTSFRLSADSDLNRLMHQMQDIDYQDENDAPSVPAKTADVSNGQI